jgi:hypothetical protein
MRRKSALRMKSEKRRKKFAWRPSRGNETRRLKRRQKLKRRRKEKEKERERNKIYYG